MNSYDLIKEAFLKRSDEFSDRFLPGALEFAGYKSGKINLVFFLVLKAKQTCSLNYKIGIQSVVPNLISTTLTTYNNLPPFLFQPYFRPLTLMNGKKTNDLQYKL